MLDKYHFPYYACRKQELMLLKKPCRVPVLSIYTFLLPALLPAGSEVYRKAFLSTGTSFLPWFFHVCSFFSSVGLFYRNRYLNGQMGAVRRQQGEEQVKIVQEKLSNEAIGYAKKPSLRGHGADAGGRICGRRPDTRRHADARGRFALCKFASLCQLYAGPSQSAV